MNSTLAHYPKPIVSYMTGITLGGGVGISAHCSVRIVTETSQVGMPETAIGLCPDVGGLYLLSRSPGELGTHAALTGARFGPGDAIAAGLADHFVPAAGLGGLTEQLRTGVAAERHRVSGPGGRAGRAAVLDRPLLHRGRCRGDPARIAGPSGGRAPERRRRCWPRCRRRR